MTRNAKYFFTTVTASPRISANAALTIYAAILHDFMNNRQELSGVKPEVTQMHRLLTALSAFLIAGAASAPADAQLLDSRYQDAFAVRVGNPGDTSALSTFIRVAVEAGQYDQALSTIEEHLINYQLDAKAHLIAARLYYHVGSHELAARHLEYALEIGTLDVKDHRAAGRLLGAVERALAGVTGFLDFTVGISSKSINFTPTAPWSDRTDVTAFGRLASQLRIDLNSSTNNAFLLFGELDISRRFADFNFDGFGGLYTSPRWRAGATLDLGLPTELLPTLRSQFTVFAEGEQFEPPFYRRSTGALVRLTALPTASSFVYVEAGYAWLGNSTPILFEDHRFSFEAGATKRIIGSHTIGIAGRGYTDRMESFGEVGRLIEGELSYAGQVWAFDNGPVWTQNVGVAYGYAKVPNLVLGPARPYFAHYWRAYWKHNFQLDDHSSVDFEIGFRDMQYENLPVRDQSHFDASLSYTVSLY